MQTLRLFVILTIIAALRCYELSQNLAEFYCVVNGNYSNKEQVEKDDGGRTLIGIIMQPVYAPALSELPVMYFEVSNAGVLLKSTIGIVREGDDGAIFMKRVNFTGNSGFKPGTFDTNKIKYLKQGDLQGQAHCKSAILHVKPYVFYGGWEDCVQTADEGKRGFYVTTNTCNKFDVVIPVWAPENATLVPYMINRLGLKWEQFLQLPQSTAGYPLENAPANYMCNCDTTGD